jgi:hypothetical protein
MSVPSTTTLWRPMRLFSTSNARKCHSSTFSPKPWLYSVEPKRSCWKCRRRYLCELASGPNSPVGLHYSN